MSDVFDLSRFYSELDALFVSQDGDAIENYLRTSMRAAEATGAPEPRVAVANELGGLLRVRGNVEEAAALYEDVLRSLEKMGLNHSPDYATALLNTGDEYIAWGNYDRALEFFEAAEALLKALDLVKDYRMAALCNNLSAAHRLRGDLGKASLALQQALDIIRTMPDMEREQATTLVNLGQLAVQQGRQQEAADALNEALGIFERPEHGRDVHHAMAYAARAELFYLQGRYDDSVADYEQALALIERDFGRSPSYDTVAANLEKVCKVQGLQP